MAEGGEGVISASPTSWRTQALGWPEIHETGGVSYIASQCFTIEPPGKPLLAGFTLLYQNV